jgi:hypothetical protein
MGVSLLNFLEPDDSENSECIDSFLSLGNSEKKYGSFKMLKWSVIFYIVCEFKCALNTI